MNDAWIEVDQGRRRLDWTVCFGDLDDADYLTPAGRVAGARAVSDLGAFFGPDWLHRATNPADRALMPELGPFWPSLMKAPAFVAAIGLVGASASSCRRSGRGHRQAPEEPAGQPRP